MNNKKNEQKIKFPYKRMNRNFLYEIGKNLTTIDSNALYLYLFILGQVKSKTKSISTGKAELSTKSGIKDSNNLALQLLHLKNLNLIFFDDTCIEKYEIKDSEKYAFCTYEEFEKKAIRYKIATNFDIKILSEKTIKHNRNFVNSRIPYSVSSHIGFFFVDSKDIETIVKSSNNYSETDIACDIFLNTIWADDYITESLEEPVAVLDRYYNKVEISFVAMAERWNCSVGRIAKVLDKLEKSNLIYRKSTLEKAEKHNESNDDCNSLNVSTPSYDTTQISATQKTKVLTAEEVFACSDDDDDAIIKATETFEKAAGIYLPNNNKKSVSKLRRAGKTILICPAFLKQ